MAAPPRVLVVDDEPIVRDVLGRYLRLDGFDVEVVADGEAALAAADSRPPDLVVLDLMLPRLDGFEVFRRLRAKILCPVIMLTAKGGETERIVGLDQGADDYVSKPFSPREVVARVRAVMRRSAVRPSSVHPAEPLRFDGFEIDPGTREVKVEGSPITLTPKEFDLLNFFASHPRRVFSRYELLEEIWDVAFDGDPSTVTVHVRRLREKIEADPSRPRRVVTVWGVGYRFEP